MGTYISPSDLTESLPGVSPARIAELVDDAEAFAVLFAPGIRTVAFKADPGKMAAVKAILRRAIRYSARSEDGAVSQQTAGQFSMTVDSRTYASSVFFSQEQRNALATISRPPLIQRPAYSVPLGWPAEPESP